MRLARDELDVRRHLLAAEEIVHLQRAQIGDADAPGRDVVDRRQDLDLDGMRLQLLEQAPSLALSPLGKRNQHLAHLVALDQVSEPVRVVDFDAGDVLTPERGIGIDESHRVALVAATQRGEQLHADAARAEDDDGLALYVDGKLSEADAGAFQEHGGGLAARHDEERCQDAEAQHGGAWNAVLAEHEHQHRPHQNRQPDAADEPRMAAVAEIACDEPVKAGEGEDRDGDHGGAGEQQPRHPVGHVERVVAQRDREPEREAQDRQIAGN